MFRVGLNDCPYCRNRAVYRSHPEKWVDQMCVLFLMQLVRCHGCMRQHYRPLFWPAPEFPISSTEKPVPTPPTTT